MQKVIEGVVVHVRDSEFEGSQGDMIKGKNLEILSGSEGHRLWVPSDCVGFEFCVEDAEVRIVCNVRVKDGGRVSLVAKEVTKPV